MTFASTVAAVVYKDLLVEWRSPVRTTAVLVFALAIVLLVAFASGSGGTSLRRQAGSTMWMGLLLASTRSLDRSFAVELEQGALEGLVLWPVDPVALFYGKAIANTLVLWLVAIAIVPFVIAVFGAEISGSKPMFVAFLGLGCAAIAAPGTTYAAITARARAASALLPVLLFPLVMPAVVAASRGVQVLVEGDIMGQAPTWLGVVAAFTAIHWALGGLLFRVVVEE